MSRRSQNQELKPPHGPDDVYPMNVVKKEVRGILTRIIETGQWCRSNSEREQVVFIDKYCAEHGINVSQYDIAEFMGISRTSVQYHLQRGFDELNCSNNVIGRPSILSEEERERLMDYVTSTYNEKYPATYQNIADFIHDQFFKKVTLDTIRHIVQSMDALKVVTGIPMENDRIFCDSKKIDDYFNKLEDALKFDIPPEFIINIDETGFQEWVDAKRLKCIVPNSHDKITVKIPRERSTKRSTMLCGICADGTTIRPMIIVSRETIEKELLDNGYTPDKVMYGRSETGFINQELFLNWGEKSFIVEMREKRAKYNYDGPILLIMDGFGIHDCDEFRELLDENNIHPILFAPHSSDQTQFLDLLIFGLQKNEMQQFRIKKELNKQTKQIISILDSWQKVTVPRNIISAFRRGGLVVKWDIEKDRLVAHVDRSFAKCVRHFNIENSHIDTDISGKRRICIQ